MYETPAQQINVKERAVQAAQKIETEFAGCGIGEVLAARVAAFFIRKAIRESTDVLDLVKEDPYILIDVPGFSLDRADKVAYKLGVPREDDRRTAAVIKIVLRTNTSSGHTYLPYGQLEKKSKKAGVFAEDLSGVLKKMIAADAIICEVDVAIDADADADTKMRALYDSRIYLRHFYEAEVQAAALLNERRTNGS